MEETRVAVVTGSNKGIGLAIVKDLCSQFEGCVYLTARDEEKGLETVAALEEEGLSVRFHQLDIDDEESIAAFKTHLEETYGGLDVLVNNAAIAYKGSATEPFGEQAENTIRVNFFGTLVVCRSLFPLLRPHARVVTLSSIVGFLPDVNGDEPQAFSLREKLSSEELTEDELSDFMNQFVERAKDGTWREAGWQSCPYSVSKVGVTALTRVQQRAFDDDPREDLIVNCCNPGAVRTDMTSQRVCDPVVFSPPNKEPKAPSTWHFSLTTSRSQRVNSYGIISRSWTGSKVPYQVLTECEKSQIDTAFSAELCGRPFVCGITTETRFLKWSKNKNY